MRSRLEGLCYEEEIMETLGHIKWSKVEVKLSDAQLDPTDTNALRPAHLLSSSKTHILSLN